MTEEIISRPYQVQLEEIARKRNTIIHLPTGSGKTHIAECLIRRFGEALRLPWGQGGKRTFFLVNTVPLVSQQKNVLLNSCPVNGVGAYSSEDGVDYWDKAKWDLELDKNEVMVMTSQILADMLTHQYIKIEDTNLLIFDECHHAVDDHPMRLIMKHFENCPVDQQPRVLGLTATLLNGNVSIGQVQSTLKELEMTFHATIATVNELGEVLQYSTNPTELAQYYDAYQLNPACKDAILKLESLKELVLAVQLPKVETHIRLQKWQYDISVDPKKVVKEVKNMIVSMVESIEEMGPYGGFLGIVAYIIILKRLKRKASTKEEGNLYTFTIAHCLRVQLILSTVMKDDDGYEKIVKHSSQKILKMLHILKAYNPKTMNEQKDLQGLNPGKKELCAIIFTQKRYVAKVLYNLIKEVIKYNPDEFGFIKHDFLVGFNVNPTKVTREQHFLKKTSQKALLMFGKKELNCIISTSVIEEGVDIPQCTLVLRYDLPLEYRSYIQSKGRARDKDSCYVTLVDNAERDKFMKKYLTFNQIERYIQKMLVGKTEERNAPTHDDIQENLYEDEIPPYVTEAGARLQSVSAISLLNRYISMLPHDQFTSITAAWIHEKIFSEKDTVKQLISIILPLGCPVKEIIKGEPQNTVKEAKRSAALNACIALHKAGELDEVTLLPKKYESVDYKDTEILSCFPNWPLDTESEENAPKPGSKKNMRKHRIAFPVCLNATSSVRYFLHIIKLTPVFPEPKDSREKTLYEFVKSHEGYGFLSQQPLPKLCSFPTFLNIGEVNTEIEMNCAVIDLQTELFELVKRFHFLLFDQVLAVAKKFVIFEGLVNCLYVVPVKQDNGYNIDWETMQKYKNIPPVAIPKDSDRKSLKVSKNNYRHKVVTPWYRSTILPDRYVVTDVLEDKSLQSQFGSDPNQTFADYYANKYNLEVIGDKKQPLLEVQNITSRMNCLLPRAATIHSFTDKQRKMVSATQGDDKPRGYSEIFVAEFCTKYEFPGVLWYKAIMLPSIIHRIHQLLVTQELLIEIAKDIKYGKPILSASENWQPIEANLQVAIKSLLAQIEEPRPTAGGNSIDRINNTSPSGSAASEIKVNLKKSLYEIRMNKINKEFPWDNNVEPVDIERNITTVTEMDIECYDEFVSARMDNKIEVINSPPREPRFNKPAALQAPPIKFVEKIKLLQKKAVGRGPELRDMVAALTTINSHDSFCLERAETLGDSFLKFAATMYLYHKFPHKNEGQLTNIKCKLISNRNLYYAGARVNLGGRMKVEQFSPRKDFLVPGFFAPNDIEQFINDKKIRPTFLIGTYFSEYEALTGELLPESLQAVQSKYEDGDGTAEPEPVGGAQNAMQCYLHTQVVSDKSVADCVEAVIGTYLLSGGILAAAKILEWFRIIPSEDKLPSLLLTKIKVDTPISKGLATPQDIHFLMDGYETRLEDIINYKFNDRSLLLEAFTHASYIRNRITCSYERLEFLGDAILDFLVTAHIFENSPDLKPGELTDLRSALVNNVTFASYVVKLGLHKYICKEMNPILDKAIIEFVEHQSQRDHEIVEDVLYLIDEEDCQVAEYVEVPKVLSDIFESLAGAIYLDTGGDLEAVWKVFYPIMYKELDAFSARVPKQPVKVLYEMIHACPMFCPPLERDPEIGKVFVPVKFTKEGQLHRVYGVGRNKAQAKRAGAKLALKILAL